jgi:hypothetical protein
MKNGFDTTRGGHVFAQRLFAIQPLFLRAWRMDQSCSAQVKVASSSPKQTNISQGRAFINSLEALEPQGSHVHTAVIKALVLGFQVERHQAYSLFVGGTLRSNQSTSSCMRIEAVRLFLSDILPLVRWDPGPEIGIITR